VHHHSLSTDRSDAESLRDATSDDEEIPAAAEESDDAASDEDTTSDEGEAEGHSVEENHVKKPKVAKATSIGKRQRPYHIENTYQANISSLSLLLEHGNAGGAVPGQVEVEVKEVEVNHGKKPTEGPTDGSRGDGKHPQKQTKPKDNGNAGGAVPVKNNVQSEGKNLKEKTTYISNLTNLKEKNTYLSNQPNLKYTNTYLSTPTYLPDPCPTEGATQTEKGSLGPGDGEPPSVSPGETRLQTGGEAAAPRPGGSR
jgi:hypothetical protein